MEAEITKALDTIFVQLYQNMDFIIRTAPMRPDDERPGPAASATNSSQNVTVKDRHRVAQEHQKAVGASSNIVHAAETLLGLTAALKQQLLLNDFAGIDAQLAGRVTVLKEGMDEDRQVIEAVQMELEQVRRKARSL